MGTADFLIKVAKIITKLEKFNKNIRLTTYNEKMRINAPELYLLLDKDNIDRTLGDIDNIVELWKERYYEALKEEREENAYSNGKRYS